MELVDLDHELSPLVESTRRTRISLAQDWSVVEPILDECEALDGTRRLVAIGAGTQDMDRAGYPEFQRWMQLRSDRVMLVTADPLEVFGRCRVERTYAEFHLLEFESRRSLYALAATTVDVSRLPKAVAIQQVVEAIQAQLA